jgi:hypothetical protein
VAIDRRRCSTWRGVGGSAEEPGSAKFRPVPRLGISRAALNCAYARGMAGWDDVRVALLEGRDDPDDLSRGFPIARYAPPSRDPSM